MWYKLTDTIEALEKLIPPKKALQVELGSERVCLLKGPDGFRAIGNECPHLGAPLHRGTINDLGEVICPWHAYCYDSQTGEELQGRSPKAKTHPIEIREDGVYVWGS